MQLLVSDTSHELIDVCVCQFCATLNRLDVKSKIASNYTYTIQLVQRLIC